MKKTIPSILLAVGLLVGATAVYAQTVTTGSVKGNVTDSNTGDPVVGATVVATSPSLQGTQAELTNDSGYYYISSLPPGTYEITVFFANGKWARGNVLIRLGKTSKVNIAINPSEAGGEVIRVEGTAPVIDQGSTKTGVTIDEDYTRNIPTGRTFQGALGAAAGSQGDLYGTSFGGSTSPENVYIVEGLNVTDPVYGGALSSRFAQAISTTNLPNEFVRETEVITGGYNAEFGRSTGAVVNVVTKSGGNEFHGSVFSYYTPGALSPTPRSLPREGSAISAVADVDYVLSTGGEVGGPIIKDKLWFHVGFNPVFTGRSIDRIVGTFIDEDGDGIPDVDENDFTITEELQRHTLDTSDTEMLFHGKLSFAASQEHQGALSVFGNPGSREVVNRVTAASKAMFYDVEDGGIDIAGKWTSKFNDNASQLDAVVGFHRTRSHESPGLAAGNDPAIFYELDLPLAGFSAYEAEFGGVPDACIDGSPSDPYPMIDNCSVFGYAGGGVGFIGDNTADRYAGALKFTQRVEAAGHHQFKVGADIEHNRLDHIEHYSGGERFRYRSAIILARRIFSPQADGTEPCGPDYDGDGMGDSLCRHEVDGLQNDTASRSIGVFAQDSWSILPNLTFNAGLRWERQDSFYAKHVQGLISPITGEEVPDKAFTLNNLFAPRVGVIYDWTKEGRSKVFGHWGRFYEIVPMDINARAYGGEIFNIQVMLNPQDLNGDGVVDDMEKAAFDIDGDGEVCTDIGTTIDTGAASCDYDDTLGGGLFGGDQLRVPDLKAQYLDEVVAGVEYELFEDFKAGATYVHRSLGRVIEDLSTDGANTYILANPGESVAGSDIADLRAEADAAEMAGQDARAGFLRTQADSFEKVNEFDSPSRQYDALQLHASQRFSRNFFLLASYTFSKTKGNHPGLFRPEDGQLDPNLNSLYDLPELLSNQYGDLNNDQPHQLKIDGYYTYDGGDPVGWFIFGSSIRAASGVPISTLGAETTYGPSQAYILPRGLAGEGDNRTPPTFGLDARVTYGRNLAKSMRLEAFFDVFNLFNSETTLLVDEDYTFDTVNPIVGGDREDLQHAKAVDPATSVTGAAVIEKNPNYGNPVRDIGVRSFRFGLRLTF